jgi:hypothetical protein
MLCLSESICSGYGIQIDTEAVQSHSRNFVICLQISSSLTISFTDQQPVQLDHPPRTEDLLNRSDHSARSSDFIITACQKSREIQRFSTPRNPCRVLVRLGAAVPCMRSFSAFDSSTHLLHSPAPDNGWLLPANRHGSFGVITRHVVFDSSERLSARGENELEYHEQNATEWSAPIFFL